MSEPAAGGDALKALTLPVAVALTVVAGVFGLVTLRFDFPSLSFSAASIGWKVATVGVMVVAVRWREHRWPNAASVGLTPVVPKIDSSRTAVAVPAIVVSTLIAMFWTQIPLLKSLSAAGEGSSYDAGVLSSGVLAFELLGRYPLQVIAEEMFFRGYLQSRLAVAAPTVAGVLFAIYHLQQWKTIPSLVPFGIALGLLRWWLGSIWPGVAFHYVGNAMFILSLR